MHELCATAPIEEKALPQWHGTLSKKKKSGGRKKLFRGKRAHERGSLPAETTAGENRVHERRTRGGVTKLTLLAAEVANVTDPATGKTEKTQIERVLRNAANMDYQRRGVITKGAIIETPLGQARVISRPGQDGVVNAILTQKAQ
jgi:small subunit ribosomal protein S8e